MVAVTMNATSVVKITRKDVLSNNGPPAGDNVGPRRRGSGKKTEVTIRAERRERQVDALARQDAASRWCDHIKPLACGGADTLQAAIESADADRAFKIAEATIFKSYDHDKTGTAPPPPPGS